jgi:serralysin
VPNAQQAGGATAGPDSLNGTAASDTFTGGGGNDTIEGFAGIDTANYSLARSNYTITKGAGSYTVAANTGTEGTDTLTHVERLHFGDTNVAMDLSGNAGTTAKILAAVFGPASVSFREYVGIGLSYLDAGVSYADLIQGAMNVALGSSTPSNTAVVNLLYTNIVGTAPSAFDLQMFVGLLDSQVLTQSALAIIAADSQVNQANINLTGLTGIEFI